MRILGISGGMHSCGLAYLKDGKPIFAFEEERFNRIKTYRDFWKDYFRYPWESGQNVSYDEILHNVEKRDLMDTTRADSPLVKAKDAIEVDNSETNREDQFHTILQLAKDRIAKRI